jgi:hypothetical protein
MWLLIRLPVCCLSSYSLVSFQTLPLLMFPSALLKNLISAADRYSTNICLGPCLSFCSIRC